MRRARRAVTAFFAATVAHQDQRACADLTPQAVQGLATSDSGCAKQIGELKLVGGTIRTVRVWEDRAQVVLSGDTVFLIHLPQGWKIAGAGCRRQPKGPTTAMWRRDAGDVRAHDGDRRRRAGVPDRHRVAGPVSGVRTFLRNNGLTLFFLLILVLALAGQAVSGVLVFNDRQLTSGGAEVSMTHYLHLPAPAELT
jgi:hypothetical protein